MSRPIAVLTLLVASIGIAAAQAPMPGPSVIGGGLAGGTYCFTVTGGAIGGFGPCASSGASVSNGNYCAVFSGGAITGLSVSCTSSLSLSTLTNSQLSTLTNSQLSTLAN